MELAAAQRPAATPRATCEVPRASCQVPGCPYKWQRSASLSPWEDKGKIPTLSQPLAPGTLLSVSWAGPASGEADRQTDRQLPSCAPSQLTSLNVN